MMRNTLLIDNFDDCFILYCLSYIQSSDMFLQVGDMFMVTN